MHSWIGVEAQNRFGPLAAVGHRVVHGGPRYFQPVQITSQVIEELHRLSPFDGHGAGAAWAGT
ncbi:MAG: hypothetical protein RIK87_18800 [Fuerstiella sp.]